MSASESPEDCLHCLLNATIDDFLEKNGGACIEDVVDDLLACLCELIASNPDAGHRRSYVKEIAALIPERVRYFRETGRYPGGPANEDGNQFMRLH